MLENDFITGGIKVGSSPHLDPYDIIGERNKELPPALLIYR